MANKNFSSDLMNFSIDWIMADSQNGVKETEPEPPSTSLSTKPSTTTGGHGHKPPRPRDDFGRRAHNHIEKRRKDKINTWIKCINELLPDRNARNQSKNLILERAYDYIVYLSKTNSKLLLNKVEEVQAEEMRRLTNRVKELERTNKEYSTLLSAIGIPHSKAQDELLVVADAAGTTRPNRYEKGDANSGTNGERVSSQAQSFLIELSKTSITPSAASALVRNVATTGASPVPIRPKIITLGRAAGGILAQNGQNTNSNQQILIVNSESGSVETIQLRPITQQPSIQVVAANSLDLLQNQPLVVSQQPQTYILNGQIVQPQAQPLLLTSNGIFATSLVQAPRKEPQAQSQPNQQSSSGPQQPPPSQQNLVQGNRASSPASTTNAIADDKEAIELSLSGSLLDD